jgi:hypothetical protein
MVLFLEDRNDEVTVKCARSPIPSAGWGPVAFSPPLHRNHHTPNTQTQTHIYTHTQIRAHVRTCVCSFVRVYVRACVREKDPSDPSNQRGITTTSRLLAFLLLDWSGWAGLGLAWLGLA